MNFLYQNTSLKNGFYLGIKFFQLIKLQFTLKLIILLLGFTMYAECTAQLDYEIDETGWAVISCAKTTQSVNIPPHIQGIPVTKISSRCFSACTMLRELILPDTITTIEDHAFSDCSLIEKIVLPEGLQKITTSVFDGCLSLQEVSFKGEISNNDLGTKDGVLFGDNFTTLIHYPVAKAETTYTIPKGVKRIKAGAFAHAKHIQRLILPQSLKEIERNALNRIWNLQEFIVEAGNENYTDVEGVLFNKLKTSLEVFPINYKISYYNVPFTVREIKESAFWGSKVNTLNISDNVVEIGDSAFLFCDNLSFIRLSNNINSIPSECFYGCELLEAIELPDRIVSIKNGAFTNCDQLKQITLGNLVKEVADSAFSGCSSLKFIDVESKNKNFFSDKGVLVDRANKKILQFPINSNLTSYKIPDEITAISAHAFSNSHFVESIQLHNNVDFIGRGAFSNCEKLITVSGENSVKYIQEHTFTDCINLQEVSFGNELQSISYGAFLNCQNLEKLSFPANVSIIESCAFQGCIRLKEISFGDQLERIGNSAFESCVSLHELSLPKNLIELGDKCFSSCSRLTHINFKGKIEKIGANVFAGCENLTNFTISPDQYSYYKGLEIFNTTEESTLLFESSKNSNDGLGWNLISNNSVIVSGLPGQHCVIEVKNTADSSWRAYNYFVLDNIGNREIELPSYGNLTFIRFIVDK